jgi:hypothetical protein
VRQSISGSLPTTSPAAGAGTVYDLASVSDSFASWYTIGNGAIIAPNLGGPVQSQHWDLVSISVQGYLGLYNTPAARMFGRFGKILTGGILTPSQSPVPFAGQFSEQSVMPPFPSDMSLVSSLWDPVVDAMPPGIAAGASFLPVTLLPVQTTILPPSPIGLTPGVPLLIGLWMTPSIIQWYPCMTAGNIGLLLYDMTYTVNYEDNL